MQPVPRRRFLELTLVSAGAALSAVACGSDADARDNAGLPERWDIQAMAWVSVN